MNYIYSNLATENNTINDSDFVSYYPDINLNMLIKKVKPSIRQATELWLIPKIGRTFYDDLATKFGADTLNAFEAKALIYFKEALAHYTICKMIENGSAEMSELGLNNRMDTDRTAQPVPQWQHYAALYNSCRTGDQFVEIALQYIYDNQSEFSAWSAPADVMLLNNAREMSAHLPVGKSILLFEKMRPFIKKAQIQLVKPLIGATNYDALIDGITNDNLTSDESALLLFINRFLAAYCLERTIPFLNLHFEDGAVEVVTIADGVRTRQAARNEQIQALKDALIRDYEQNKAEFISWLADNKTTYNITTVPTLAKKVTESINSVFWG